MHDGAGLTIAEGENLEVDPPRRLVQSFTALWGDDVKAEGSSRVTWEIEPVGDSCRLVVTHDELREGANDQLYGGWPMILSGLKTLLETGELLTTPGLAALLGVVRLSSTARERRAPRGGAASRGIGLALRPGVGGDDRRRPRRRVVREQRQDARVVARRGRAGRDRDRVCEPLHAPPWKNPRQVGGSMSSAGSVTLSCAV